MNYKKIARALAICMPETPEEGQLECVDCPYNEKCHADGDQVNFISLPSDLVLDIRAYFSANRLDSTMIQ